MKKQTQITIEQQTWAHQRLKELVLAKKSQSEVARLLKSRTGVKFTPQHVSKCLKSSADIGRAFGEAIAAYRGTTLESMGREPSPVTPRLEDYPWWAEAERKAMLLPGAGRVPDFAWADVRSMQTANIRGVLAPEAILSLARWWVDQRDASEQTQVIRQRISARRKEA